MKSQSCIRISHDYPLIISVNYELWSVLRVCFTYSCINSRPEIKKPPPQQRGEGSKLRGTTLFILTVYPSRRYLHQSGAKAKRSKTSLYPLRGQGVLYYQGDTAFQSWQKTRNPTRPGVKAAFPFHRGGSEASSPIPPAGSHQPPALWKGYAGYYSSSQPLIIVSNNKKIL